MAWVLPSTVYGIVPKRAKLSFGLRAGDFDSWGEKLGPEAEIRPLE